MDHSALAGRRVVLTQQRASRLAERLEMHGATVSRVRLTEPGDPSDGGAGLLDALGRLDEFDWLIVTSVNGARAIGSAVANAVAVRLAAVGAATAEALAVLAGRPVDLVPSVQRAEGLLAEFPAESSAILLAQGDLAGPALGDGLRARGHRVTAVEAYATVARPPIGGAVAELRAADAVVIASGSAASALAAAVPTIAAPVVVIGPSTAAAATAAGFAVAAVAASPADDDVVAAVVAALADATGGD
jgi:uroporphyrinogen-III synthase